MKVTREFVPEQEFHEFMEEHDLTLHIVERDRGSREVHKLRRYYATIKSVEIREGSMLRGFAGDGNTVEEAVQEMVGNLSERPLVQYAMSLEKRRDFKAPRLHYVPGDECP